MGLVRRNKSIGQQKNYYTILIIICIDDHSHYYAQLGKFNIAVLNLDRLIEQQELIVYHLYLPVSL